MKKTFWNCLVSEINASNHLNRRRIRFNDAIASFIQLFLKIFIFKLGNSIRKMHFCLLKLNIHLIKSEINIFYSILNFFISPTTQTILDEKNRQTTIVHLSNSNIKIDFFRPDIFLLMLALFTKSTFKCTQQHQEIYGVKYYKRNKKTNLITKVKWNIIFLKVVIPFIRYNFSFCFWLLRDASFSSRSDLPIFSVVYGLSGALPQEQWKIWHSWSCLCQWVLVFGVFASLHVSLSLRVFFFIYFALSVCSFACI